MGQQQHCTCWGVIVKSAWKCDPLAALGGPTLWGVGSLGAQLRPLTGGPLLFIYWRICAGFTLLKGTWRHGTQVSAKQRTLQGGMPGLQPGRCWPGAWQQAVVAAAVSTVCLVGTCRLLATCHPAIRRSHLGRCSPGAVVLRKPTRQQRCDACQHGGTGDRSSVQAHAKSRATCCRCRVPQQPRRAPRVALHTSDASGSAQHAGTVTRGRASDWLALHLSLWSACCLVWAVEVVLAVVPVGGAEPRARTARFLLRSGTSVRSTSGACCEL
jgi:hypothetical protein